MTMIRRLFTVLLALLIAAPVIAQAQRAYSQAELDQMLAPVALYPDQLLSQVLMAATYPIEVAEAARWSRANPGLHGEDAVRAAQDEDWDPSVKSLLAFPQILARMDENPDWTRRLGDAFLMQEPHVMDTVQQLRMKAQAAGSLQSGEQIQVQQQGRTIVVQPASPQFLYVPYYDPLVVYGPWWWPGYQPVVWAPWPGYVRPYRPGVSAGFWWGRPVGLSLNFFFGDFDWLRRHVRVVHANNHYYRPPVVVNRVVAVERGRWQHDPHHRRGWAQPATPVQVLIQPLPRPRPQTRPAAQPRVERSAERQAAPAAAPMQAQPAARVQVQAVPQVQPQAQPQARTLPVVERREQRLEDREPARIERRETRQAPPQIRQELPVPAARVQATPQVHVQPQVRMPAASAPQQPRAERQEQRQELREQRQERREERGQKAGQRS